MSEKRPGCNSFRGVGRVEIGRGIEEALHGAIAIERRHVEEHLSRFEGKEERASVRQLTDPTRQVTRHDQERILELAISFGGQLGIHKVAVGDLLLTRPNLLVGIHMRPVTVERVQNTTQRKYLGRWIVDRHVGG